MARQSQVSLGLDSMACSACSTSSRCICLPLRIVYMQGRMYTLNDVWIRPNFGGKGRKVTGQLEAHTNGFRYSSPKGETLDIMYRSASSHSPCVHPAWMLKANVSLM